MDPQQRLLLETAWEACEYAGVAPSSLRGSDTGVFVGLSVQSYGSWLLGSVYESADGFITSGNSGSMASGRISHLLGLEGPSMTLDAACSSSAVAIHLANQSLRARECSMAIVGGVTIMSTPWMYLEFCRQALFPFSTDGHCKSFADSANGTTFSEGLGMLVLERLSDARRNGHNVLAVIRGSALNQDGVSNGLTAPNGLAHERVMRQALANAGVSAGEVDAVEGHGMGTVLGDPIEIQALMSVYGREHDAERPLWLGAIKSNIGHTQAASTIAGVIKMVMALRSESLPRTLHVDVPSRHVDWSSGTVRLLTEPVSWPKGERPRRAAVHAFGISGTNVHLILEEPTPVFEGESERPAADVGPATGERPAADAGGAPGELPWVLSAVDEQGLREQAKTLLDYLRAAPDLGVADVAFSLASSRDALSHRAVLIGADREQLLGELEELAGGAPGSNTVTGTAHGSAARAANHDGTLESMAEAWVSGASVPWDSVVPTDARLVRLPTYRFRPRRHWPESSPIWESGGLMGGHHLRERAMATTASEGS
jgi:acyl transferase domain-containing protein